MRHEPNVAELVVCNPLIEQVSMSDSPCTHQWKIRLVKNGAVDFNESHGKMAISILSRI
jgi:hypothetical protein